MTIDQVIDNLKDEKQKRLEHRFPCRAIMTRNISDYCTLLNKLQLIDGVQFVPSDMLFSGADVMPHYENLTKSDLTDQWFVLTGVSEYLRLFSKSEAECRRFANLWNHTFPSSNLGRIIIPLWDCEAQWHDRSLQLVGDLRKEEIYFSCMDASSEEQQLRISVFANSFKQYKDQLNTGRAVMLDGLKAWYDYWGAPSEKTEMILFTDRLRSVVSVDGNISINVVRNVFSFIQNRMAGTKRLSEHQCPEEAQKLLFNYALNGEPLEQSILSILNVASFVPMDVMGKWNVLSKGQRQLVRLWIEQHPDESYLYHCAHNSDNDLNIEDRVLHEIFRMHSSHPNWVEESQKLIAAMKLTRDNIYFETLDLDPNFHERLNFLSGSTQRERCYLLRMAGLWLRENEDEVYENKRLKSIYPELFDYLDGTHYDENLCRYMKLYKTHKLANTLPADESMYFAGIQPEKYDYRFSAISSLLDESSIVLWIDALGVEWMPLLIHTLEKCEDGSVVKISIGQANLPTETEFNKQWEKMQHPFDKMDELDKLAHKGVVDDSNYYSCVEEQIAFVVTKVTKRVESLLRDYHRVIITGDHGTSRLAARFFHKRNGNPLPQSGKAFNHGRYALIPSNNLEPEESQICAKDDAGNHYLVFKNYDHFTQSGFAGGVEDDNPIYGEVHGGATPEEILVPIIAYESTRPVQLTAQWENNQIKISRGKATATIIFNQKVVTLDIKLGTINADTKSSSDGKRWTVIFRDVKSGSHDVILLANGKLVSVGALTIQSAIGNLGGDLDL